MKIYKISQDYSQELIGIIDYSGEILIENIEIKKNGERTKHVDLWPYYIWGTGRFRVLGNEVLWSDDNPSEDNMMRLQEYLESKGRIINKHIDVSNNQFSV